MPMKKNAPRALISPLFLPIIVKAPEGSLGEPAYYAAGNVEFNFFEGGRHMKSQDKPKTSEKKKPQKTLKEKRAEKKAKKESKTEE